MTIADPKAAPARPGRPRQGGGPARGRRPVDGQDPHAPPSRPSRPSGSSPTASPPTWRRGSTCSGSSPSPPCCVVIATGLVLAIMGPNWWHVSSTGPLRQLAAPVERRDLHVRHGRPPVGQVLHGRLAGQAPGHLDHRGRLVPGVGRRGLHRLPVPAEFRLPVDQHPGQGRHQLDRCRRHLQRDQLRPDDHVAHRAAARCAWWPWSASTS